MLVRHVHGQYDGILADRSCRSASRFVLQVLRQSLIVSHCRLRDDAGFGASAVLVWQAQRSVAAARPQET
jgi:hypothetical protein